MPWVIVIRGKEDEYEFSGKAPEYVGHNSEGLK